MFDKKFKKICKDLVSEAFKVKELKEEVVHSKFENQPEGTDDVVNIKDIWITNEFRKPESKPNKFKMIKCRQEYARLGHLDKPIEVRVERNEFGKIIRMILVDKYTRILCGFEFGLKVVPVKYIMG